MFLIYIYYPLVMNSFVLAHLVALSSFQPSIRSVIFGMIGHSEYESAATDKMSPTFS